MKNLIIVIIVVMLISCSSSASFNINSGQQSLFSSDVYHTVNVYNDSIVNIMKADISFLHLYDNSIINILDTTNSISIVGAYNNSIINFFGGEIDVITLTDNATVHMYGGGDNNMTNSYTLDSLSKFHIYGSNFNYDYNTKFLTGILYDGSDLNIFMRSGFHSNNIILHTIPEPTSILFLLPGIIFFEKK